MMPLRMASTTMRKASGGPAGRVDQQMLGLRARPPSNGALPLGAQTSAYNTLPRYIVVRCTVPGDLVGRALREVYSPESTVPSSGGTMDGWYIFISHFIICDCNIAVKMVLHQIILQRLQFYNVVQSTSILFFRTGTNWEKQQPQSDSERQLANALRGRTFILYSPLRCSSVCMLVATW